MKGPIRDSAKAGLAALGAATAIGQATLLREAMAALGGSEMAWGAVLGLWLVGTGVGSWLAAGRRGGKLATSLPAVSLALAFGGVVALRAAPVLSGALSGEVGSTWELAWLWSLAVLPSAGAGGAAFASLAARVTGAGSAAAAYASEAFGACAGGAVFTFALAPVGSAGALVAALGLVLAWQFVAAGRRGVGAVVFVLGVAAAGPAAEWVEALGWGWAGHGAVLRIWRETREQRLEVAGDSPRLLYADGRLVAVSPDPWRIVPRTHLLMLLGPSPRRVLAVGSLADGSLPVMLRHPVVEVAVVEEDAGLVEVVRVGESEELGAALGDPRVEVLTGDPLRALERTRGRFDLILLLDGDPSTLRRNRTRTEAFFRACAGKLSEDGALAVRVGVPDTYLGGAGGRLLGTLASTLRLAFPAVTALPGEDVVLVAGSEPPALDLGVLEERWQRRGITDAYFSSAMIGLLVDPGRQADVREFLAAQGEAANTAAHPRAVLFAAALGEGRGAPGVVTWVLRLVDAPSVRLWTGAAIVGIAFVLAVAVRRWRGVACGGLLGLSSMTWWLLLMASWQSRLGSVYAEIGLLSGLFMAGLGCGALTALRLGLDRRGPLAGVLALGAAVSTLLASGAALAAPRLLVVPLLVLGGAVTGAGFPGVARLSGGDAAGRGVGRAFGADEIGAGAAAVLVGLIGLPVMGMFQAAAGLAVLQGLAAAALAVGRDFEA